MRISNPRTQKFLQNYKSQNDSSPRLNSKDSQQLPKDKVHVTVRENKSFKIKNNNPNDPTVSTKVLDGLSSGMIHFSQEQRDVLAKIMSEKAEDIKEK